MEVLCGGGGGGGQAAHCGKGYPVPGAGGVTGPVFLRQARASCPPSQGGASVAAAAVVGEPASTEWRLKGTLAQIPNNFKLVRPRTTLLKSCFMVGSEPSKGGHKTYCFATTLCPSSCLLTAAARQRGWLDKQSTAYQKSLQEKFSVYILLMHGHVLLEWILLSCGLWSYFPSFR